MENSAELILRTIDRHLQAPAEIRLLGGAALILAYGLERFTEDADLLLDEQETRVLIDNCDLGRVLEATNSDLEPQGLYVTHIWGPEQQILTPNWRTRCRPITRPVGLRWLQASVLGPLDLILSKLCRADDQDLADIRYLIAHESLSRESVVGAMDAALVPVDFAEVFPVSRRKVERLFDPAGLYGPTGFRAE